jgi:zinc D-Ala-D-Ala carboxypeptidase
MIELKHFKLSEFDSPDAPSSGEHMDGPFLIRLDDARERAGVPFRVTSGYRTREHNAKVGGVEDSAHTKGLAVDIAYRDASELLAIVTALAAVGFNRLGLQVEEIFSRNSQPYGFIHVDLDDSKPRPAFWGYP